MAHFQQLVDAKLELSDIEENFCEADNISSFAEILNPDAVLKTLVCHFLNEVLKEVGLVKVRKFLRAVVEDAAIFLFWLPEFKTCEFQVEPEPVINVVLE